jgi:hypothetical protein
MVYFNFTYQPGVSLEQMTGFEMAGKIWSSYLQDNVTLNIHVGVTTDLPDNVIGGALPGTMIARYETWRNRFQQDMTSTGDQLAFQNLQDDKDKFTALVDGYKTDNNYELTMTRANAKALGLLTANDATLDGFIQMRDLDGQSVNWGYDYLRTGVAPTNTLDFLSVALHEVGHVLGFVSGVDKPGWLLQKTNYNPGHISDFYASLTGKLNHATSLDLFRYSAESVAKGGSGDPWIDLSIGGNPYFSIDGGKTVLANYATGNDPNVGGDGYQASHWQQRDTNSLGIMNPTLAVGQQAKVSALDLTVFDVIGWDLKSTSALTTGNLMPLILSNTQVEAKQKLANEAGMTIEQWEANPLEAAQLLAHDRLQDIAALIDSIFEGRRSKGGGSWQEVLDVFWQEARFSTFDLNAATPDSTGSVVEPVNLPNLMGDRHQPQQLPVHYSRGSYYQDVLRGTGQNDTLLGLAGNDVISGRAGDDQLQGNQGRDWLIGRDGADWLSGGNGSDLLVGGAGSDVFVVQRLWGVDVVRDFAPNQDKLQLPVGVSFEQLTIMQVNQHTLISFENKPLMQLLHINAEFITAANVV